jgi:hypothetical protein
MIVRETTSSTGCAPWTRGQSGPAPAAGRELSVAELVLACQREETRSLARAPADAGFGYELFRRARCLGDVAVPGGVAQFRKVLRKWVKRHPALGAAGGEADDWVDQTFSRLWLVGRPERLDQFPDLAALLRYPKLCVHGPSAASPPAPRSPPGPPSGASWPVPRTEPPPGSGRLGESPEAPPPSPDAKDAKSVGPAMRRALGRPRVETRVPGRRPPDAADPPQ